MKLVSTIILVLVLVSGLSIVGMSAITIPQFQSPNGLEHPVLYNTTYNDPSSVKTTFYSFEAYKTVPPNVTPKVVVVAKNVSFPVISKNPAIPYNVSVTIPSGTYSYILMNVSVSETNGTQYDRQFDIFLDGVPIFWGSTQEINNSTASVDMTEFENLLLQNATFEIFLPAYQDFKIGVTGIYLVNVTLYLYPGAVPPGLPNYFVPLPGAFGVSLLSFNPLNDMYQTMVSIPNGTYRVQMMIYTEGGGNDEFWYTNEPATRSVLVYYNGYLADVVNPYETLYTGGIDLFWWKPMPSVNTLSFHNQYVAELTPLLVTGNEANITICVTNLLEAYELTGSTAYDWSISGVLMLWVNSSNPMVSGKLLTAKSSYMDSTPILNTGINAEYYQEGGSYHLHYISVMQFMHGKEISNVTQSGLFSAYQTFNNIYEKFIMNENFSEFASDYGMYNASLSISMAYPTVGSISDIVVPITNPEVIPFNASYLQNGSIRLGFYVNYMSIFNGYNVTRVVRESLYAKGGFAGILEIINSYGGALLVALTNNYASNHKVLTAVSLTNGKGYMASFNALAISPSISDSAGYYSYASMQIVPVSISS
ncbi:hypothetical protein HS7_04530 [Sulfolobales archaeon HS-7]|nr:hypothetical protein HS7_04530 [Sulfolobales archaeon HS-7]